MLAIEKFAFTTNMWYSWILQSVESYPKDYMKLRPHVLISGKFCLRVLNAVS